jgi:23S rRNA (guanine2445-N2)-methyltransferase / 23S rRNA (guanine2069-N7)-methyltransferase
MCEVFFPDVPPEPRPLAAPDAAEPPRFTARTLGGIEWVLARELEAIGAIDLRIGRRTIEFAAAAGRERETLYRSVLEARTAIRVLEPLGRFRVSSPKALYDAVAGIDWREQLRVTDTLRVDATIHDTFLTHSLYAAQVVKDAVVDQLRTPSGKRPGVSLRGATLRLALHLVGDVATVFRDAAGRSLHQRGWRTGEVEAPLSEVLAAGILAIAGWWRPGLPMNPRASAEPGQGPVTDLGQATTGEPFLDPMCGSGTFLIEAATIAAGMAPGLWRARRQGHGLFRFRDCDRPLADRLVAALEARVRPAAGIFLGSDLDPRAVAAARACAVTAGVDKAVVIEERHFEAVTPPAGAGLVVTNPPYGERLPLPRAAALYRRIGDWLVARCGGWRAAILAADSPALKHLGLRPRQRIPLANGAIPCRLVELELRPRSKPPATILEPGAATVSGRRGFEAQAGDFRRRLTKRFKHLGKWARRQGIEAFRVYDRDIPEIPLAIDWYAGWLHVAEYDRPHERTEIEHDVWLDRMMEVAAMELGVLPGRSVLKARRRQRGGGQYEKLGERATTLNVSEAGLVFEVNLSDYLDTGLFLDHRQTRELVRAEAAGKRILNLFCYTGSFSVYAAAGGARETVSVDLSNTYLDWTRRNLQANGFDDDRRHAVVRDEARAFLEHRARRGEAPFDLVIADPPTFSRSAKSDAPWDVERDHAELLNLVAANLTPGGVVFFSTNFRRFHLAADRLAERYSIRDITARTIPEDFRDGRPHRTWRLVLRNALSAYTSAPDSPG